MEVNYLYCSSLSTVLSFVGLQWWASSYLDEIKSDGLVIDKDWIGILLQSNFTLLLCANFAMNLFLLVLLCLKSIFFNTLNQSESRKIAESSFNYLLYKGLPVAFVMPSNASQYFLWPSWLLIVCALKVFESTARDRLERLNASPSITPLKYIRVYSALFFVLIIDLLWTRLCLVIYKSYSSSNLFLVLFFEPLSIAFETLQAIIVYGFQLFEIWRQHIMDKGDDCFVFSFLRGLGCKKTNQLITDWFEKGAVSELRGILVRNLGFILDMASLLMSLSHYVAICCIRGITLHVADLFLLVSMRGLVSAMFTRVKTYIKLRKALKSLGRSLSDASYEEICAYNDECAICRGPMSRAKKLPCKHLFHLSCLRAWLDQGYTEMYSCPTCRRPLSLPNQTRRTVQPLPPVGTFPPVQQQPRPSPVWRGVALDAGWVAPAWQPSGQSEGASSSLGIGSGVQMMMRQLTSAAPPNSSPSSSSASTSSSGGSATLRNDRNTPVLRINRRSRAEVVSMVNRVREVLPHVPEELIIQDLARTNNINITVNNLLMQ